MKTQLHMKQVLEATGLYALPGDSPTDWELDAFGTGFAQLEGRRERLLQDLFPQTAGEERLSQWEALFRPQPAQASLEDRRAMIQARWAAREEDFTPQGVQALLVGAGVQGLVLEEEGGLTVVLGKLLGVSKEEAARELDQLLPAHLAWTWEESVTWVALDAYTRPFGTWKEEGLTWAQWDAIDRSALEQEE